MKRSLTFVAALLLVASGCGGSDDDDKKAASAPSATPTTASYVAQVNALCSALIDQVVPITGDSAPLPTAQRYLSNRAKLMPIYREFDAAVADVPASTDADQDAKAAFAGSLAAADAMDADLTAKAAELGAEAWMAEIDRAYDDFEVSPDRAASKAAGITCPAR